MKKNVPISDRGMATTGMMTARKVPRNRKITAVTISSAWIRVFTTSRMDAVTNFVLS